VTPQTRRSTSSNGESDKPDPSYEEQQAQLAKEGLGGPTEEPEKTSGDDE